MDVKEKIEKLNLNVKAQLLTGANFWTTKACDEIGLGSFMLSDGPHGMRVQDASPNHLGLGSSRPSTCYPTASAMACSWDEGLCEELGKRLGKEAAYEGVSVVLGPGMNIKRSPLCGRNFEYFSEDTYLSGKIAAAYVRGIQSSGPLSCIKHFAVNSRELGRMYCDSVLDEQTLRETYLTSFEMAVKEGKAGSVMTAYNKVNGEYCNANKHLISDILRGEWGFDGLVVSDWGGTYDRVASLDVGADLEMPSCGFSAAEIVKGVESGKLNVEKVNKSVERIYNVATLSQNISRQPYDVEEHNLFAQKCAEESLVLLKNDGDVLPLKEGEEVALIGDFAETPRYQGAGSSLVNPTKLTNILTEIKASNLKFCGFERGFKRRGGKDKKLYNRAIKLANKAQTVVICLGLDEDNETEGADRTQFTLPENQIELLAAIKNLGKKVVVILSCGSSVDMSWDRFADGIIHSYLGGQSGATAAVNALCGKINPSGRLAESYPKNLADVNCADDYFASPYKMTYDEGIFVGYKYYTSQGVEVKYPFGYGLSYTKFEYSDIKLEEGGISFTVKNVGKVAGAVVAQMYICSPRENLAVSPNELKGFKKIFLQAGEERREKIPFDNYTFRVWSVKNNSWSVGGTYEVCLANNCLDVLFKGKVTLDKDTFVLPQGYVFSNGDEGEKLTYQNYVNRSICAGQLENNCTKEAKKHKRIVADYRTEVADLKYCKGFLGKLFGFIAGRYARSKDKLLANSMVYLPVRSLMQFMKFNDVQAQGFLEACNGKFFKGIKKIICKK